MNRLSPEQEKTLGFHEIPVPHRELLSSHIFEELKSHRISPYHDKVSPNTLLKAAATTYVNNLHLRLPGTERRRRVNEMLADRRLSKMDRELLEHERDEIFSAIDKAIDEKEFNVDRWRQRYRSSQRTNSELRKVAVLLELWPVFKAALKYVDLPNRLIS